VHPPARGDKQCFLKTGKRLRKYADGPVWVGVAQLNAKEALNLKLMKELENMQLQVLLRF
jgi:hypothetical protein